MNHYEQIGVAICEVIAAREMQILPINNHQQKMTACCIVIPAGEASADICVDMMRVYAAHERDRNAGQTPIVPTEPEPEPEPATETKQPI